MPPQDPNTLYGIRPPRITRKEISSSTSLAFTSALSGLLTASSASRPTQGRPRSSKTGKDDIFSSHNRNTKKRAARDLEDDSDSARRGREQKTRGVIGAVDDAVLHRSKKKMGQKAKLYKEMNRKDYIPREGEDELVDFDRKWSEREEKGGVEDSSDSEEDGEGGETIEFEDEYGRLRKGTKADAERMERRKMNKVLGQEELDRISARPTMPTKLIYGDTVQTLAFNPDEPILEKMEEIAMKRDRSMTPPEQKHYEADKEFRIKGVGFYSFSKDEGMRKREMEALENERAETGRMRREREEKKEKRKKEIEERRKTIGEKRVKKYAETFLDGLGAGLGPEEG